ncbi:MAG: thiamine-phosphate synthase family protein [Halobacteriota archaeon]
MTLKLPSEVVAESFLPAFRLELAQRLDERDMTQQEIADVVGVSQPAVSNYVSGDVEVEAVVKDDPGFQRAVEEIADGVEAEEMGEFEVLSRTVDLVRRTMDRGPVCEVHEREQPALRGRGCDICVRDAGRAEEEAVLHSVRRAVRRFRGVEGVAEHVPAVGSNVAEALEHAEDSTDVAAVPGRLYVMRGGVHVPSEPEFGASRNVAEVVLAAMERDGSVRAGLNVATSAGLLEAARSQGFEVREFDAEREERAGELRSLFESGGADVVYHRGAFGVEPVTYVLGESASDAVEKLEKALNDTRI